MCFILTKLYLPVPRDHTPCLCLPNARSILPSLFDRLFTQPLTASLSPCYLTSLFSLPQPSPHQTLPFFTINSLQLLLLCIWILTDQLQLMTKIQTISYINYFIYICTAGVSSLRSFEHNSSSNVRCPNYLSWHLSI